MQRGFVHVLVIIVIVLAAGIGGYFIYQNSLPKYSEPAPEQKACTQEAKLCPDGSSVGRSGPNCEFAPCPTQESSSSADIANWKTYTNRGFSIKYPTDWVSTEHGPKISNFYAPMEDGIFSVIVEEPIDMKSIEDELKTVGVVDDVVLDGVTGKTVKFSVAEPNDPRIYTAQRYELLKNGKRYSIGTSYNQQYNELGQTINQILSTFKFLP